MHFFPSSGSWQNNKKANSEIHSFCSMLFVWASWRYFVCTAFKIFFSHQNKRVSIHFPCILWATFICVNIANVTSQPLLLSTNPTAFKLFLTILKSHAVVMKRKKSCEGLPLVAYVIRGWNVESSYFSTIKACNLIR